MDLPFPHIMLLPKLPSMDFQTIRGLTEYLIHHYGVSHSIASGHGTHYTPKEVWQWAYVHGTYWSYHVLHHPETAGFTE